MALGPKPAAAAQRFGFVTPEGFVSLKGAAPVTQLGEREAKFRAEAFAADAYAVKLRDGVAVAMFVAKVTYGPAPVTTWKEYLERSLDGTAFANDATVLSAHPISMGGVQCAFADVERVTNGAAFRERYYAIPGGDHWAFVKLLARADDFGAASGSVEEAVKAITGISPNAEEDPGSRERGRGNLFIIGASTLAAALFWEWVRRSLRKRRSAKRERPERTPPVL